MGTGQNLTLTKIKKQTHNLCTKESQEILQKGAKSGNLTMFVSREKQLQPKIPIFFLTFWPMSQTNSVFQRFE